VTVKVGTHKKETIFCGKDEGPSAPEVPSRYVRSLFSIYGLKGSYTLDGVYATRIQKIYRGHRARLRTSIIRIRHLTKLHEQRQRRRRESVMSLQRVWRGRWCRLLLKRSKMQAMAVRIQCRWRAFLGKKLADHKRATQRAMRILVHNMSRFLQRIKSRRIRHQQLKYGEVVGVIQRLARRYIGRCRRIQLKHALRVTGEQREYGQCKTVNTLCAVQLRIIVDSMSQDIGKKSVNIGTIECPMQGPLQALFVAAVGSRARTELHALITNKLDSKSFLKFGSKLEHFLGSETVSAAPSKAGAHGDRRNPSSVVNPTAVSLVSDPSTVARKRVESRDRVKVAVLIDAIASNRFVIKHGTHSISQTDLDLIFAETKEDPTEGSVLTFKEFLRCIDVLANIHFHRRDMAPKKADKRHKNKANASSNKDSKEIKGVPTNPNSRPKSPTSRVVSPTPDIQVEITGSKAHRFRSSRNLTAPLSIVCGETPHYGLILCLQLMAVYRHEKWMMALSDYLDAESWYRLSVFVVRVQCMVRRRLARKRLQELMDEKRKAFEAIKFDHKVVIVQSILRRFIGTRRCCRIAQTFIIKYVTHNSQEYYFNPSTRVSSWSKPRVLRQYECTSIPLPPTGLEVMVKCSNCSRDGQTTCLQCEDTYCNDCYMSLHCKGNRRVHEARPIPKCSYCKFQVATKNCLTCVLNQPEPGTSASYMKASDRGRYCDPCFCHHHDEYEIELAKDAAKKVALNEFIENTREAYIVKQFIHQKLRTDHRFEHVVQTCEECLWRCASWRCEDCNQIYCHKCLVGLHSITGPFQHHKAEGLPYYTKDMHVSYQHDLEDQQLAHKLDHQQRDSKLKDENATYSAVIKLQSWWRGRYYARAGRDFMKKQRKRLRFAWRLRKREDREFRRGRAYQIRDWLGWNPPLGSDTREEAVLKRLNVFKRERVREVLMTNLEDWGWYRTSPSEPRKGVPRTGFEVGTVAELTDQALNGGKRLPGRIILKGAESCHQTTMSLEGIVQPGQMLRLREQLFFVTAVTSEMITLDRKWFSGDMPNGELMYLVPSDSETSEGRANRGKYRNQRFLLNNFLTQTALSVYVSSLRVRSRYSLRMARTAKRAGAITDAVEWRDYGSYYADRAAFFSQYLLHQPAKKTRSEAGSSRKSTKRYTASPSNLDDEFPLINDSADGAPAGAGVSRAAATGTAPAGGSVTASSKPRRGQASSANKVEDTNFSARAPGPGQEADASLPMHLRHGRQPGVEWFATPEEQMARRELESTMTKEEIAESAMQWEERINPVSGTIYYVSKLTTERSEFIPTALALKRGHDEEVARAKKKVDEAKAKMADLQKKSVKFTGAKKR
jgi:hypothetical protein